MLKKHNYDNKYSGDDFYWGLKPSNLVMKLVNNFPNLKNCLDLGCGEGKNSFYLAKNGFSVTAVDNSEVGIAKLSNFIKDKNLDIKSVLEDIISYVKSDELFDSICCMNSLQFIDEKNIFDVIKNIQSKTVYGGVNIIASFIAENDKQRNFASMKKRYLFSEGELKKLYSGWEIIHYEEVMGDWETHGSPKHRHYVVELIAKKTS